MDLHKRGLRQNHKLVTLYFFDWYKQLNLPSDSAIKQLEMLHEKLDRGFSIGGFAMDELSRILNQHGFGASIQNNSLQLLKHDESLVGKAISLSAFSGLKGRPQIGGDKILCVNAVLMPELLPGSQVHIESQTFTGFAIIQKVRFCGDNFAGEWGSEITCCLQ